MIPTQDVVQLVEAYDSLLRHPGWKLLENQIHKAAEEELSQMAAARNTFDLERHTSAYLTICKVLKMPEMVRTTLAAKLQPKSAKL